jgi:ribonuclease P protein component
MINSGFGAFFVYFDKKKAIKQFTLHKSERLKKRKIIEHLFNEGSSFSIYPFRVFYFLNKTLSEGNQPLQFGTGASKRNFKKAVDRNRIKRLIREAYRTQKLPLQQLVTEQQKSSLQIFIIFTGKELPPFDHVNTKVAEVLERLGKEILKIS